MQQLIYLKQKMVPLVGKCLETHEGGESYFTELDRKIKENDDLLVEYLIYATGKENIDDVAISGEIGLKMLKLQKQNRIPSHIKLKLIVVNGGLRRNPRITKVITTPAVTHGNRVIFFDDSYYSGKTADTVKQFIKSRGGTVIRTYVFYDGCKELKSDVLSLYRYY